MVAPSACQSPRVAVVLRDSSVCFVAVGAVVRIIILRRGHRHLFARTPPHAVISYISDHHLLGTRQLEDPKASV